MKLKPIKFKSLKNKKWVKPVIAIIIMALIGTTGVWFYQKNTKVTAKSNITYINTTAKLGNIEKDISASGTVASTVSVNVTTQNSGKIVSLPVKEGDTVKVGQQLAKIDDTSAQQNVQKAYNNLNQQNLALSKLQNNLNAQIVKAPSSGRIKSLNIAVGDDAGNDGKVFGSLMTISTDGKMKISISTQTSVSVGESVTVNVSGKNISGTVYGYDSSQGKSGNVIIQIGEDDLNVGAQATAIKSNGTTIGIGTLSIDNPITISGYTGTITSINVSENSVVSKGDTLFQLSQSDIQNSMQNQNLVIQQAQNDYASAQQALANANITSPVDGIVAVENNKQGDSVQSGTAIMTIIDPNQMQTVVQVDELDIGSVKVGMNAKITLDAFPNNTYTGQVLNIANVGTASNGVTTYAVTVSISNPNYDDIKEGMTTNVSIAVASKQNVVILPVEAVQGSGNNRYVILPSSSSSSSSSNGNNGGGYGNWNNNGSNSNNRSNGGNGYSRNGNRTSSKGNMKRVQVGISNDTYIEIVSGLNEGDTVLIPVVNTTNSSSSSSSGMSSMFGGMGGFGGSSYGGNRNRSSSGNSNSSGSNSNRSSSGSGNSNGNSSGGNSNKSSNSSGSGNYGGGGK